VSKLATLTRFLTRIDHIISSPMFTLNFNHLANSEYISISIVNDGNFSTTKYIEKPEDECVI
jgi:hypothetical protein